MLLHIPIFIASSLQCRQHLVIPAQVRMPRVTACKRCERSPSLSPGFHFASEELLIAAESAESCMMGRERAELHPGFISNASLHSCRDMMRIHTTLLALSVVLLCTGKQMWHARFQLARLGCESPQQPCLLCALQAMRIHSSLPQRATFPSRKWQFEPFMSSSCEGPNTPHLPEAP